MSCSIDINLKIRRDLVRNLEINLDVTESVPLMISHHGELVAGPMAPENLSLAAISDTTADLDWDPSPTPGIDSYTVYVENVDSGTIEQTITGIQLTEADVMGLDIQTEYDFLVTAVKDGIESSASNTVTGTTTVTCDLAISSVDVSGSTVTVNANSSYGPIEYSIWNAAGDTIIHDWQDSNEFIVSSDGEYIVKTRDDNQCSAEESFSIVGRSNVTITMIVNSTSHSATTNTEQALLDAGFLQENITIHADGAANPPDADIVLIVRAVDTQTDWDRVSPLWEGGTPVIFGQGNGLTAGTGRSLPSTFADITGTFTVDAFSADEEKIINNTHTITSDNSLGLLVFNEAENYCAAIDDGANYLGTALATGDPDATINNLKTIIAVPAGTEFLSSTETTPAKSVVWGNLYGGQGAYTADGAELLAKMIEWCIS